MVLVFVNQTVGSKKRRPAIYDVDEKRWPLQLFRLAKLVLGKSVRSRQRTMSWLNRMLPEQHIWLEHLNEN